MIKKLISFTLSLALIFSFGITNAFANEKLIEHVETSFENFQKRLFQDETHLVVDCELEFKVNGESFQKMSMLINYLHSLKDNQGVILTVDGTLTECEDTEHFSFNAYYKENYIYVNLSQDDVSIFTFQVEVGSLDEIIELITVMYEDQLSLISETEELSELLEQIEQLNEFDVFSSIVEENDTIILTINNDSLFNYLRQIDFFEDILSDLIELGDQFDFSIELRLVKDGDEYVLSNYSFILTAEEDDDEVAISLEVGLKFIDEVNLVFPNDLI